MYDEDVKGNSIQDKIIFEEQDGLTEYSIVKGIFYISDLQSKHLAYRVMKHVRYEKPTYEFCWDKVKAETVLKELMKQVDKPLYNFDGSVLQN